MPAPRQQNSFPAVAPGSIIVQLQHILDQLQATLNLAGYSSLRVATDGRGIMFKFPALDRYYSHSDLIWVNINAPSMTFYTVQDFDVQDAATPTGAISPPIAVGSYSGSWPSGPPIVQTSNASASANSISINQNGFTVTTYASEHGFIVQYDNGTPADFRLVVIGRPVSSLRHPRILSIPTKGASFPITIVPPVGAHHLSFNMDGNAINVTFPTGTLNVNRVVQEISMQSAGLLEGTIEEDFGSTSISINVPYDSEPIFGYSSTMPQLSLTYIDPTVDSLRLYIYKGTFSTVSTTHLKLNGTEWVKQGVRIGATVYNRTKGNSATVADFTTTTTQSDTLVGTFPGTWVPTDVYLVLPGPELWPHGQDIHSALQQGCPSTSNVRTHLDGLQDYFLNDFLGEAQNHYQLNQTVMIANNGTAIVATMSSLTGYVNGDFFTDGVTGTQGFIRAVYPGETELILDVTVPPTSKNEPAFKIGDTITGLKGGGGTISSIRSCSAGSDATIGWYQRVPVVAISQVSPSTGDYRTKLTLDLTGISVSARLGPCVVINHHGRLVYQTSTIDPPSSIAANQHLALILFSGDCDIVRNDQNILAGNSPRWSPDYETGSLILAEVVGRMLSGLSGTSNDIFFTLAHFRSVSGRNPAILVGSAVDENGDPVRRWRMVNKTVSSGYGSIGDSNHFWTVGPGAF